MAYGRLLPLRIDNIRWLAKVAGPFPTTSSDVLDIANAWGFDEDTIDFLGLFPDNITFSSRDDFLFRCAAMEAVIKGDVDAQSAYV